MDEITFHEPLAVLFTPLDGALYLKRGHKACLKVNQDHHLVMSKNTPNGLGGIILSITSPFYQAQIKCSLCFITLLLLHTIFLFVLGHEQGSCYKGG